MTRLRVGDMAPEFELLDNNGKSVKLSELRGRKVWLYFFTSPGGKT